MNPKDRQEEFVHNLTNCQPAIYAYILSLLPSRNDAADVLQDTNLVLWRRSDEYVAGTNFIAWAYKIARFKVLAHHRDRHRDRHIFDEELFAALADRAERRPAIQEGLPSLLDDCLQELPASQRSLIEERYSLGGSVKEIARRLGQSAAGLSVSLSRIRQTLLECVHRKMGGEPRRK